MFVSLYPALYPPSGIQANPRYVWAVGRFIHLVSLYPDLLHIFILLSSIPLSLKLVLNMYLKYIYRCREIVGVGEGVMWMRGGKNGRAKIYKGNRDTRDTGIQQPASRAT